MPTTVINIKDAPAKPWPSNYVYIGRGTAYGNPFRMRGEHERDSVCERFTTWLLRIMENHPEKLLATRRELQGKVLVCHCKPKRCHGDLLAYLADGDFSTVTEAKEAPWATS